MVTFRFYLVSLVAVFLALAMGVVVGSTLIDRAIVDRLDESAERNGQEVTWFTPPEILPGGAVLLVAERPTIPIVVVRVGVRSFGESATPEQLAGLPVDLDPMQVTQWNLAYQRQFMSSMMFDVTYMGNNTTHIWSGYEENPVVYVPGNHDEVFRDYVGLHFGGVEILPEAVPLSAGTT